jgi:hypothetical protein
VYQQIEFALKTDIVGLAEEVSHGEERKKNE